MTTIQDVADLAGVSISSVSNVLNGRTERLGKKTFERVQAAIAQLDYRPNLVARQLKTGHAPMLGLLVPSTANPMFGEMALHVEKAAQQEVGYRLLLGNTYRDPQHESRMFDDLLSLGVRGVIVVSSRSDERHMDKAIRRGMAVVSYDRGAGGDAGSRIDHVSPDNIDAGRLAVRHLVAHGHRRLALITPNTDTVSRALKHQGFMEEARSAGLDGGVQVLQGPDGAGYGDSQLADLGYELARKVAQLAPGQRPTGAVAINDMLALGFMSGLAHHGLQVPGDVSVVGMDGTVMSAYSNPGLTSVAMPLLDMAQAMVLRVLARLEQPQLPPGETLFQPTLVERQSVAAPRNVHP